MLIMIYGADGFRVKERVAEMRQKFVEKFDTAGMNLAEIVVRVADDARIGDIGAQVQASPFMSTKRMTIVRGLMSTVKKPEVERWYSLFAATPESSIVILVETVAADKVKKMPLFLALADARDLHTYVVDALQGLELRSWVMQQAAARRMLLSSSLADVLIARVGLETWALHAEIAKIAAYALGEPVTKEMIELLCGAVYREDVFGLLDALSGSPAAALERLAKERSAGAEDFPLFGMLIRQVRLLLAYKLFVARNGTPGGAAAALGIHPFVVSKLQKEADKHSLAHLRAWHDLAVALDKAMKRGLSPTLAVDRLATEAVMPSNA